MRLSVFRQTLTETRLPLLCWTAVMAGAAGLVLAFRPLFLLIGGENDLPGWLAFLLGESHSPTSPELWVRVIGFGLVLPALLVAFTIHQGSWLVAGEEERSSLGLLLAATVQRHRLILEKFGVLVLLALVPVVGAWLALNLAGRLGLLPVGASFLAVSVLALFLVGLAFGSLAMALGAVSGRRRLSSNIAFGFAFLALLISRLPGTFPIQPVLRFVSPFYYYNSALHGQYIWQHALGLLLISGICLWLTWIIFDQRDLPA